MGKIKAMKGSKTILRLTSRRGMFARLKLSCLFIYLSIGMVFATTFHRIAKELQSPYQNEPAYGEQSWVFEAINLLKAWDMGYTGHKVRVRINADNWEFNHTEWDEDRLIQGNKNARQDYSCGDPNNRLEKPSENDGLNHGAAVTSILGADGTNGFCGTGIAPLTKLSFCNFRPETTQPTVLSRHVTSRREYFDISINAFAYEGCSSAPRGKIVGLHRQERKGNSTSRHLQPEEDTKACPFLKDYDDEVNRGDDPCKVCTNPELDFIANHKKRDNIFQVASVRETTERGVSITSLSVGCGSSVRNYCSRKFRRNEALCTEWIELINYGNVCQFKNNVGVENNDAFDKGVKKGRDGKGVVYIFAAGDSYGNGDNVNYHSYSKSRFVMTVGAVKLKELYNSETNSTTVKPIHSTYSTGGTSIFVVAPGGDYDSPHQHVGAGGLGGLGDSCVNIGYGTSFAVPIVGGVVALMLEAHNKLTWRDVRVIIAETSKPVEFLDNENSNDEARFSDDEKINDDATFETNAAGVGYSDLYGFGLIDAAAAVEMAETWKRRDQHAQREIALTASSGVVNLDIFDDSFSTTTSTIPIFSEQYKDDSLESVSVYLKLRYFNRGHLRITLTSPSGTVSLLSPGGRHEYGQLECNEWWEFLTLRNWGESPYGVWKLSITDTERGSGDVTCIDRPSFSVPFDEYSNKDLTCEGYASEGFCVDGKINDYIKDEFYATLFETNVGECDMTATTACCVCGGGIRPDSDEVLQNQLEEWKIVLGDGSSSIGTKRVSNYDPFLPEVTTYEFIRCKDDNFYGEKTDCCNGLDGICDLRVNEVLFATLHNGMNAFEDGSFVAFKKQFEIERALEAGYRAFKLDICNCNGEFEFCFGGMCNESGSRDIIDVMFYFKEFLEKNPSEVVIFFFDVRSDVDQYVSLPDIWLLMEQIEGFQEMVHVQDAPNSETPWPTLRELVSNNERIIMFQYNGPNCEETPLECPDQFHYYYDWVSDNTERLFRDPVEIENPKSLCDVQELPMTENPNSFVGLSNFLTPSGFEEDDKVTAIQDAERLNEYSAAQNYVDYCGKVLERDINFIQNDWWGVGEVLRMTQDHNMARAFGNSWIAPTSFPTASPTQTNTPTTSPTLFPTTAEPSSSPSVSIQPSMSPTDLPTDRYDPCPKSNGSCQECKQNIEECFWCVTSSTCHNRLDFGKGIDSCVDEDRSNSFDPTCAAILDDDNVMFVNMTELVDKTDSNVAGNSQTGNNSTDKNATDSNATDSAGGFPGFGEDPSPMVEQMLPPVFVEATDSVLTGLFGDQEWYIQLHESSLWTYICIVLSIALLMCLRKYFCM